MTNPISMPAVLAATPSWDPVPQFEKNTPLLGGPNGEMNAQAQALLNRTEALNMALGLLNAAMFDVTNPIYAGGADKTGVAESGLAVLAAAAALQANGGGVLYFPPGTYKVTPPKGKVADYPNEAPFIIFTGLHGVAIMATGAVITDGNVAYTTTEAATLFKFDTCKSIAISIGKLVSYAQPNFVSNEGLNFFRFFGACSNIDANLETQGGSDGLRFYAPPATDSSLKSENIRVNIIATNTHKPLACAMSGNGVRATIKATGCGRNYYIYGVNDHQVHIRSKNQQVTTPLAAFNGEGCSDIEVWCYDRESDNCQAAAPHIQLVYGDSTPATHRNIKVHLNVKNNAGKPFGHSFSLGKYLNGDGITVDNTGRGHVLDGLYLTGSSEQVAGVNHFNESFGQFAVTGTPDIVRNWCFDDLTGLGSGNFNVSFTLKCLVGVAVAKNIYCAGGSVRWAGNTTSKIVMTAVDASELCDSTTDISRIEYIGCNARNGTQQSYVNKTFHGTWIATAFKNGGDIGHQLHPACALSAVRRIDGDLTGTVNVFRYKSTSAGALFRLKWYAVADRGQITTGTRSETEGVITFTAGHNSVGTWWQILAPAAEAGPRSNGTATAVTVSLVNGSAADGGYIAVSFTNYNGTNARATLVLEAIVAKDKAFDSVELAAA